MYICRVFTSRAVLINVIYFFISVKASRVFLSGYLSQCKTLLRQFNDLFKDLGCLEQDTSPMEDLRTREREKALGKVTLNFVVISSQICYFVKLHTEL